MKESDIRKYAQLMKELELTGLEITEDNQVVRLERSVSPSAAAAEPAACPAPPAPGAPETDVCHSVTSPIVGLFYAAPAENAEPYVSLGDRVKKGQTLCIVEAMKLMNEIESDFAGTVTEICVKDGDAVEYGQTLMRILED